MSLKKLKKFIRHFVDRLLNCHVLFLWAITTSTEALRSQTWISSSWCIISVLDSYRKLVRYFHIVSECMTVIYFSWSLILSLAEPVQLFWPLVTFGFGVASRQLDRLWLTTVNRDRSRAKETFIYTIFSFLILSNVEGHIEAHFNVFMLK